MIHVVCFFRVLSSAGLLLTWTDLKSREWLSSQPLQTLERGFETQRLWRLKYWENQKLNSWEFKRGSNPLETQVLGGLTVLAMSLCLKKSIEVNLKILMPDFQAEIHCMMIFVFFRSFIVFVCKLQIVIWKGKRVFTSKKVFSLIFKKSLTISIVFVLCADRFLLYLHFRKLYLRLFKVKYPQP